MKTTRSLRKTVRIISFSIIAFLTLSAFAVSGYTLAQKYKQDLEYSYVRALNELSDYISNLEITLNKGIYANTLTQQQGLSNKIMAQSMGAKAALEQLPIEYSEVENINKFISQTSEYSNFLSNKVLKGNKISDEELKNLKKLGGYAKSLNSDLKTLLENVNRDSKNVINLISNKNRGLNNISKEDASTVSAGFKEINDSFTDYPTLIYDGPFSDHIIRMKSKFLENQVEISIEEAKKKIMDKLSLKENEVEHLSDVDGNLPCYRFNTSLGEVLITKSGGYIKSIVNERNVNNIKLDFNEAKAKAEDFMKRIGYGSLKESYYIINDGVCTINYAFEQDNVIYYKDLIKIGITLDNGKVVFFDSTGYLMNHVERQNKSDFNNLEKAKNSVSKGLNIKNVNKVFIPTLGLEEVACYEFECTGENKEKVLVYINAKTFMEEQIYIVIESDNGTLVM